MLRNSLRSRVATLRAARTGHAMPAQALVRTMTDDSHFGKHLFTGDVAAQYLSKHGLSADTLDSPAWAKDNADTVAAAVLEWARDNGASAICHWFQPMGASGVRHGNTGQVHNRLFTFGKDGKPVWELKGKDLVQGETDGSSFPNGGLRATHTAGGYLGIDTTSPIFIRGDLVHVPACFVSYYGHALDEKTMLHRSNQALSREGTRLLGHLGLNVDAVSASIGLEQEFFLVPREQYYRRLDLQMTGRTVMGLADNTICPRGQEMCDHYMAAMNPHVMDVMNEIMHECYLLGIPLRTRHREVAPNQYEFAPMFGTCTTQTDQNLMVMQIIEEVAARHNLAALMQEKPFAGVNGSGKHNNWSLWTDTGVNLLAPDKLNSASGNPAAFPTVMAAIVRAVNVHGDMMRSAIASPGNDFRLGACEAPPAILSAYLGEDMTGYLERFTNGEPAEYVPGTKLLDMGVDAVAPFEIPAQDRNRTSPFPYGGGRFEFRAVGSSQNVSMVNTVLNTITAESMSVISDAIEGGQSATEAASAVLKENFRCVFNGNNYSDEWPIEAGKRGIWRIDSGVEALDRLSDPKNTALFSSMGVMTEEECKARATVNLEHYKGFCEMEAMSMIGMIKQHIIPSATKSAPSHVAGLEAAVGQLEAKLQAVHAADSAKAAALEARELRLEVIEEVRLLCDACEAAVPAADWTIATYKELLFLDQTLDANGAASTY